MNTCKNLAWRAESLRQALANPKTTVPQPAANMSSIEGANSSKISANC